MVVSRAESTVVTVFEPGLIVDQALMGGEGQVDVSAEQIAQGVEMTVMVVAVNCAKSGTADCGFELN